MFDGGVVASCGHGTSPPPRRSVEVLGSRIWLRGRTISVALPASARESTARESTARAGAAQLAPYSL